MKTSVLREKRCKDCGPGTPALTPAEIGLLLPAIPSWETGGVEIQRTFNFKDYHQTMAFVNAVAWLAHRENHHPDMEVSYNRVRVRYSSHSVGGLSEND